MTLTLPNRAPVIRFVLVALALSGMRPDQLLVAQEARTFRACFVPAVGVLYLIAEAGLPATCLSPNHREITWREGQSLTDSSVTQPKLAGRAVGRAQLADTAVGTAQLGNASVTQAKLAPGISLPIGDGTVTTAKLADSAVTQLKLGA